MGYADSGLKIYAAVDVSHAFFAPCFEFHGANFKSRSIPGIATKVQAESLFKRYEKKAGKKIEH